MVGIVKRYYIIIVMFSILVPLIIVFLSISNYVYLSTQNIENNLTSQLVEFTDSLNQSLLEKMVTTKTLAYAISNTFDYDKGIIDEEYFNDYKASLIPMIYQFALDNESAWIYFNPDYRKEAHDIWMADSDRDGIPERQPEQGLDYYNDFTNKEWFTIPKDSKKPVWVNPYDTTIENAIEGAEWLSYSYPIFIEGNFLAVIGTDYDAKHIKKQIEDITVFELSNTFLLNMNFDIIYHSEYEYKENFMEVENGYYKFLGNYIDSKDNDTVEFRDIDGKDKILAFSRIENGFSLISIVNKDIVYNEIRNDIFFVIAISIICLIITNGYLYYKFK